VSCDVWSPDDLPPSVGESTKTGILLDTETTGLDPRKDEVIELGMVKFDYLPDGRVVGVRDVFSSFNEPSVPIPTEVTALTGITHEMVAGQRIRSAEMRGNLTDHAGRGSVRIRESVRPIDGVGSLTGE